MIYIGIDTGTHTGIAAWDSKARTFREITTLPLHRAIVLVLKYWQDEQHGVFVVFEDARQRKWYGSRSDAKIQGAGSIKRDCAIWEDFLRDYGIPFRAVPPQAGCTKMTAARFTALTKWRGRTSEHARDAAMLVWGK